MGQKAKEEVKEVIILEGGDDEENAEGVGRDVQQGGEVHPSGGTDSSLGCSCPYPGGPACHQACCSGLPE